MAGPISPPPAPNPIPHWCKIRALVDWRAQLKEQWVRARQQGEHTTDAFILKQQAKLGKHLQAQIETVEKQLAKAVASSATHQEQVELLDQMPGVGFITAITVLCHMPELGPSTLSKREPWPAWHPGCAKAGLGKVSVISAAAEPSCATPFI